MASVLDTLTIWSVIFLVLVRVSGFVCFLGIGVGVAVASWFLGRFLLTYNKKPARKKSSSDDIESQTAGYDDDESLPYVVTEGSSAEPSFQRQHPRRQVLFSYDCFLFMHQTINVGCISKFQLLVICYANLTVKHNYIKIGH